MSVARFFLGVGKLHLLVSLQHELNVMPLKWKRMRGCIVFWVKVYIPVLQLSLFEFATEPNHTEPYCSITYCSVHQTKPCCSVYVRAAVFTKPNLAVVLT